jgi:RNA polymerase-binding transcription factor DksA
MSTEDIAQELEALDWERNNRPRVQRRLLEPDEPGYGPAECEECEIEMPPLRRAMGRHLCTYCTERGERRSRQIPSAFFAES